MAIRPSVLCRTLQSRSPLLTTHPLLSPRIAHARPLQPFVRFASRRVYEPRPPPRYNRKRKSNAQTLLDRATEPLVLSGATVLIILVGSILYHNVERVPISNRLRINFIPAEFEEHLGAIWYQSLVEYLQGRILPADHPASEIVQCVMNRLIPFSGLEGLNWEVKVIDDPGVRNAFIFPG